MLILDLIIKDILIQKKTIIYAFLCSILLSISFSSLRIIGLGLYVLCPMMTAYFFISYAVTYDDKNKSEVLLNSLPIKRADIVISKYISLFVFAVIGVIFSIIIGFIWKITWIPIDVVSISLVNIVLVFMSVCIMGAIFFPPYFKFGFLKTRIFNMLIFMALFFLPLNAVPFAIENPNNPFVQKISYFINNTSSFTQNSLALATGVIFFVISLMISICIYNNKEF